MPLDKDGNYRYLTLSEIAKKSKKDLSAKSKRNNRKEFLGLDSDYWKFIGKLNIGIFAFLFIFNLFPNQAMIDEDIFWVFFLFNAPLWYGLSLVLYSKIKK